MNLWEAIVLGILQGLTEFLPVSSSGHLEIANYFFGIDEPDNLRFVVALHGGTVLSTVVVFARELGRITRGFLKFRLNDETVYVANIMVSMIPLLFVGLFLQDFVEKMFTGSLMLVGSMMLVTAALLAFSHYAKPRRRPVAPKSAFIIGLAQAAAVLPGLSRSGATISAGLLLGIKREEVSKFSFLMVLIPVIGMNILEIWKTGISGSVTAVAWETLFAGFAASFITGILACRWMISLVNRGKLIWFAVYCFIMGIAAIMISL